MADLSKITLPNASTVTLKDNSQAHSDHRHYGSDIVPLVHKLYESTSYYATSATQEDATWYFLAVKPDSWYLPWRLDFKVHSYCPNYPSYESITWSTVCGREQALTYANWNERYDTAHYYVSAVPMKKAGFDAGYSHAIGISILYGGGYTTAAYYRTFELDYFKCENCTVTILDTPTKLAGWTGYSTTNFNGVANYDAVSRGLRESGDENDGHYYARRVYSDIKAGSNKIFPYTFIMQNADGRWESIVTSYSTSTSKSKNPHGFLLGQIMYMSGNATYNENAVVGTYCVNEFFGNLLDHRYSFNTANDATYGTTANKPLYIVGTIGSDGLFYLADKWWAQDLPTTEDGLVYIYVGDAYDNYRMTFTANKKMYHYAQGHIEEYSQNADTRAVTSGDIVSFNSTDILPLKNLTCTINPVQDLHGQDYPYPRGGGKNKLNAPDITISQSSYVLNNVGCFLPSGNYVLSFDFSRTSGADRTSTFRIDDNNGNAIFTTPITIANGRNEVPINLSQDGYYLKCYSNAIGTYSKFQIESGSSATPYAPYENICPITGHTELNLVHTGKNYIDLSLANLENGTINGNTGALESATNRVRNKDYYVFPFDKIYNSSYIITIPSGYSLAMRFYDSTGTYIAMTGESTGWITELPSAVYGKDASYVKFVFRKTDNTDITPSTISSLQYQLELGSTATAYEPYTGTTTTTDFGTTVYGCTLEVVSGVLTLTHKYMVCSKDNQTWVKSNYYDGSFFVYASTLGLKPSNPFMCSHLASLNSSTGYAYGKCFADSALNLWIMASGSSLDDFKNYLDSQIANGTPVTICGELAEPITIQLTPQEVKSLLGGNNIYHDCNGQVAVTYYRNTAIVDSITQISRSVPTNTSRGSICSFTDGADNSPIISLSASVSGSGCNVVKTGKNLLHLSSSPITVQGVTFKETENGITITGSPSSYTFTTIFEGELPLGNCTICDFVTGSNSTHQMVLRKNGTTMEYITAAPYTFSVTSKEDVYSVRLYIYSGNTHNLIKPQLEVGSTASSYEAYKSTTYPITFPSTVTSGSITINADGTVDLTSGGATTRLDDTVDIRTYLGANNIWVDTGDISELQYYVMNDVVTAASQIADVIAKQSNTTYTFADGTNGFTVTPSGGTAQTVTVTPSIANNVTGNAAWTAADVITTTNASSGNVIKASGKTIATSITNVDTTVPTSKAVKTYVDGLVANATHFKGGFAASGDGAIDGGSTTLKSVAEAVGDLYTCTTAGTIYGIAFEIGDSIIFKVAVAAGTAPTSANFITVEGETSISVVDNNPTLSWGAKSKVATIEGAEINVTMPSNPNTDTKNTAGSTDTASKIFLVGATSQAANPQTYSQDTAYVGTDGHVYSNSKQVVNLSDTQALINKTYNGYTLAAACAKAVVTSVDTSASLPTSNAVKTFVEGKGYVTTDTKNTAGSTDTSSKIYLVGATSQAANPQTYSDNEIYATSGVLTTKSVQVGGGSATMQYNTTTQSLDFVFT